MKDFIEIKQDEKPHRLINIHQIADVTVTNSSLRLKMSYGENVYLKMGYDDFVKLIDRVATVHEERIKSDIRVITVFP